MQQKATAAQQETKCLFAETQQTDRELLKKVIQHPIELRKDPTDPIAVKQKMVCDSY